MSERDRTERVTSVVSEQIDEMIELVADARGVSKSEYIAEILEDEVVDDVEGLEEEDMIQVLLRRQDDVEVEVENVGEEEWDVKLFPVPHVERVKTTGTQHRRKSS